MSPLSRRSFLQLAGMTPVVWSAVRFGGLRAQTPVTRPEARTPEGIAMLAKYAKAVEIMKDPKRTPSGSPLSWQFQWFMHWTPEDKDALLQSTYPKGEPAAFREVAVKTWATCQAHFQPAAREPFFLPWHRWYLSFFESILRATLKDDSFALPYWDYLKDARLPPQFTMRDDATFKPLFHDDRGLGINDKPVNEGDPIMTPAGIQRLMHDALCQRGYPFKSRTDPGFCAHIDFNLHGGVHGAIGGDMGGVPTAAQDPIFWLHHCNIDRLWASWNANGGSNPNDDGFKKEPLTFADSSAKLATRPAGGAVDTLPLGYKYDRLEPRPADCPLAERETAPVETFRAKAPVALDPGGVRVTLTAVGGAARETAGRILLVIGDVATPSAPGTLYNVYVNLPETADAAERESRLAGHINFFDLAPHQDHRARSDKFFTFDITDIVRTTGGSGPVSVAILPRNPVAGDARPTVGEIRVFRR